MEIKNSKKVIKNGYVYTKSNSRINYTPELHTNQGKSWTVKDLTYLCGMREKMKCKDVALALGRTHGAVLTKAHECRKDGTFKRFVELFNRGVV